MTLIKTSLLNSCAVLMKMLALLGINKILAVYVGPSGYAALGQFQNLVQMTVVFASGAINTGVVKYTAEYQADIQRQHNLWRTAGFFAVSGSLLLSVVIAAFSLPLSLWLLNDDSYQGVFLYFSFSLVLCVLNATLLAVLNGKKEIGLYVSANIVGSILSVAVTVLLTVNYGLYGALLALVSYQALAFFSTVFICYKAPWFKIGYFGGGIDYKELQNLAKYIPIALVSAISMPVSHMFIRGYLGQLFGADAAGYWEAMWRLSAAYLMVITTTLSVYFLPKLSELKQGGLIRQELLRGYSIIIPVGLIGAAGIFFARDFIIFILFSENFSPMRDLFFWQLIGDAFKVCSWLLGFVLVAKAEIKAVVFSELIFAALFFFLTMFFCEFFELEGVVFAYACTYFIHLITMAGIVKRKGLLA